MQSPNDTPNVPAEFPPAALRGLALFTGKAGCWECHAGPMLTTGEFHDTGVPPVAGGMPTDAGRFTGAQVVKNDPFNAAGVWSDAPDGDRAQLIRGLVNSPDNWGRFRTPSLREVSKNRAIYARGPVSDARGGSFGSIPHSKAPCNLITTRNRCCNHLILSDEEVAARSWLFCAHSMARSKTRFLASLRGPNRSPNGRLNRAVCAERAHLCFVFWDRVLCYVRRVLYPHVLFLPHYPTQEAPNNSATGPHAGCSQCQKKKNRSAQCTHCRPEPVWLLQCLQHPSRWHMRTTQRAQSSESPTTDQVGGATLTDKVMLAASQVALTLQALNCWPTSR